MYITKILETTIPSGGSVATFTDSDIPNSLIRVFSTNSNIYPLSILLTGNTLTVTYENLSGSLGVAVELVKDELEIVDALNSTASDKALSAYQGKVLYDALNNITIPEDISDLDDVQLTDIEDGQVLAWDAELEKFVNVDQSSGGSDCVDVSSLITVKNTVTLNAGSYKYAYKIGKMVFLYFQIDVASGYSSVGTAYAVFNIDSSLTPVSAVSNYCRGSSNSHSIITVTTGSVVNVTCGNWGLGCIFWSIA